MVVLNELFLRLGLEAWKPVLGALVLPPVPFLLLMLIGATQARRRPVWAWLLLLLGAAGIWLGSTVAVGEALQRTLLAPAHALTQEQLKELQVGRKAGVAGGTAIVVLGGGREGYAPEYGSSNLGEPSMERLRYGLWLSRETGAPLAFSGGTGHAQVDGPGEAQVAARIAEREFGKALKWAEDGSRDTRENAARTVSLLQPEGVTRIVLVTHGWHMRRSQRAFEQAIERRGGGITVVPAPMGLARSDLSPALRWLPSSGGFRATRQALHEYAGWLFGA
jgi:uncharacterized SAM-binding protein YcdF (DUF218 family)